MTMNDDYHDVSTMTPEVKNNNDGACDNDNNNCDDNDAENNTNNDCDDNGDDNNDKDCDDNDDNSRDNNTGNEVDVNDSADYLRACALPMPFCYPTRHISSMCTFTTTASCSV